MEILYKKTQILTPSILCPNIQDAYKISAH